jgi:heme/copper-type cytochrome/quinol oxidase subunit 1
MTTTIQTWRTNMEKIKVKLQQWSLLYREYIVGFAVGVIIGAILF